MTAEHVLTTARKVTRWITQRIKCKQETCCQLAETNFVPVVRSGWSAVIASNREHSRACFSCSYSTTAQQPAVRRRVRIQSANPVFFCVFFSHRLPMICVSIYIKRAYRVGAPVVVSGCYYFVNKCYSRLWGDRGRPRSTADVIFLRLVFVC